MRIVVIGGVACRGPTTTAAAVANLHALARLQVAYRSGPLGRDSLRSVSRSGQGSDARIVDAGSVISVSPPRFQSDVVDA